MPQPKFLSYSPIGQEPTQRAQCVVRLYHAPRKAAPRAISDCFPWNAKRANQPEKGHEGLVAEYSAGAVAKTPDDAPTKKVVNEK
jgi:hypothetical protein